MAKAIQNTFKFKSEIWLYPGDAGNWHFVSIPKKESETIKKNFDARTRGWGSLRVGATIGKTAWETSIFPDKKSGTYLLPVKAAIRKKEGLFAGDMIALKLEIL